MKDEIEEVKNMSSEKLEVKKTEITLSISVTEKYLVRLKSVSSRLEKIIIDINYHSAELKELKKLHKITKREAVVVLGH